LERLLENLKANLEKNPQDKEDILLEIQLIESKKNDIAKNPSLLGERFGNLLTKPKGGFRLFF
jgi:hypothetical protein